MEDFAERQNLTLSGDASSLVISGLNPNTNYMVGLYGMHQGSFLEPLYSEATTGTWSVLHCSQTFHYVISTSVNIF